MSAMMSQIALSLNSLLHPRRDDRASQSESSFAIPMEEIWDITENYDLPSVSSTMLHTVFPSLSQSHSGVLDNAAQMAAESFLECDEKESERLLQSVVADHFQYGQANQVTPVPAAASGQSSKQKAKRKSTTPKAHKAGHTDVHADFVEYVIKIEQHAPDKDKAVHVVKPLLHGAEFRELHRLRCSMALPVSAALEDAFLQDFVSGFDVVQRHLTQDKSSSAHGSDKPIYFDQSASHCASGKVCLVSSAPLDEGDFTWRLRVDEVDVELVEMGVIGTSDIKQLPINQGGVARTHKFGARSVFGSELSSESAFYASYNESRRNEHRCFRDLSADRRRLRLCASDVLGICLDLVRKVVGSLGNALLKQFRQTAWRSRAHGG